MTLQVLAAIMVTSAEGRNRTGMPLRAGDFKAPRVHKQLNGLAHSSSAAALGITRPIASLPVGRATKVATSGRRGRQ
jgi:hypothetical protein